MNLKAYKLWLKRQFQMIFIFILCSTNGILQMMQISPQSQFKTCSIIMKNKYVLCWLYFGFHQIHKIFAKKKRHLYSTSGNSFWEMPLETPVEIRVTPAHQFCFDGQIKAHFWSTNYVASPTLKWGDDIFDPLATNMSGRIFAQIHAVTYLKWKIPPLQYLWPSSSKA